MYIENCNVKYPCGGRYCGNSAVGFVHCEGLPETMAGEIKLCADDGFLMAVYNTADFLRVEIIDGSLTLTNVPLSKPHVPTLDELRQAALERIDGKCSGAIYAGLDITGKHYSFTQQAQSNIKGMMIEAQQGKTVFLYAADGEPLTAHTVETIAVIAQKMGEWINVNLAYNEQLRAWIKRETDSTVMGGIDYGVMLPADLMQTLGTKLATVGVNFSDYSPLGFWR